MRLKATNTSKGTDALLMALFKGGKFTEQLLHRMNNAYWIKREIFKVGPIADWPEKDLGRKGQLADLEF